MTRRNSRAAVVAAAAVVALLGVGFVLAGQIGAFLGISVEPVEAAPEVPSVAPMRAAVPAPSIGAVVLPEGASDRLALATTSFQSALADRGAGPAADPAGAGTLTVRVGEVFVAPASDEAFRVTVSGDDVTLSAADEAGAAAGLYRLADRVRTGNALIEPADNGVVQQPGLALRLVDKGAAGVSDDPDEWRAGEEYSHNSGQFAEAILSEAPFVDAAVLDGDEAEFRQYVDRQLAQGYNGIVMPGFLEYVTFEDVDGIYAPGSDHVRRAAAMRENFGPLWQYAHDMGMKVFLSTDMLALSTPLQQYLDEHGLDAEDPELWDVYAAGLAEFFDALPYVDGLLVRIGEGGSIYALPGWDYWSEIAVTTPAAVQAMLEAFTEVAEEKEREIIFRTWSVGVGAVGDLHTNPESYEEVLGEVESDALIVSTKHVAGDFYSYLPLNPTLDVGEHRRIVEVQSRREFEGFGALPNDLAPAYSAALEHVLAANPNVEGVWSWTQDGGPVRAGPLTLFLRTGFWQLWDLNSYAASRLAWDPGADPAEITADWARETFSDDPATVEAIGQAMALSRSAILQGLYIEPFAEQYVRALGLEIPTQTWLFEWDIVTGDTAVLDSIYSISKDRLGEAIDGGRWAVGIAEQMRQIIDGTDPAAWRDPALRQEFLDSLDYEIDLFEVLADYRATTMFHAQWLDTGASSARSDWENARAAYEASRAAHLETYGDDLEHPAFLFTAADLGTERSDRDPAMAWVARTLLVVAAATLALGTAAGQRLLRNRPGARALHALWTGATRPWRLGSVLRGSSPTATDRVVVVALPAAILLLSRLAFTWFAAPAHLVLTLGAWLLFGVVLWLIVGRRRDPFALYAVIGGVALLRSAILLVAVAQRGPGRYWYVFWTEPTGRAVYITLAFAAFGWLFVAASFALRSAYGVGRRGAVGRVVVAVAAPLVVGGLAIAVGGTERALTVWNDQLALIPWGLSRILGITTHLGIPTAAPWYVAVAGVVLAAVGGVAATSGRTAYGGQAGGGRAADGGTVGAGVP